MKLAPALALLLIATTPALSANFAINPTTSFSSGAITAPSSTMTSYTATTLSSGQAIAPNPNTASIFPLENGNGGALTPKFNLTTNATSGWGGATVQVNVWTASPTYSNADGATYAATAGSAILLDTYSCTFIQFADKAQAICTPNYGTVSIFQSVTGANIYWDLQATSTVTKTSGQTFTLTPLLLN